MPSPAPTANGPRPINGKKISPIKSQPIRPKLNPLLKPVSPGSRRLKRANKNPRMVMATPAAGGLFVAIATARHDQTSTLQVSLRGQLALGHHQMVGLMVPTLHHDSHEAERLEFGYLLRVISRNGKLHSIRQVFGLGVPTDLCEFADMRGDHASDRLERATLAGHCDLNAAPL